MKNQSTNITVTTFNKQGVTETKDVTGKQLYAHRSPQELASADRWAAGVAERVYGPYNGSKTTYIGV